MNLIKTQRERESGADVALRRWTAVQRERLLEDRLDALVTVLDRLVVALERPAHE